MNGNELIRFCDGWLKKAKRYQMGSLSSVFDRFFTVYVVFNKLYSHSALELARQGTIQLDNESFPPDKRSATDYILRYVSPTEFLNAITAEETSSRALEQLTQVLVNHEFNIILTGPSGESSPEQDRQLVQDLQSNDPQRKMTALLLTIYHVRCNLFHGHKAFSQAQLRIMVPLVALLESITQTLYQEIRRRRAG